jgi:hypothetical protein
MDLGFQTPDFKGVGNDWQAKVNMAHILKSGHGLISFK